MTTQFHELPEDEYPAILVMMDRQTGETIMHLDRQVIHLWATDREQVSLVTYEAVAMHEVNRAVSHLSVH